MLLLAVGAILLAVSLFLDWFEPGLSAWTVFEVWDLVLAALALMALVAVASRMQFGPRRPDSWLLTPALVAPVVVVASLLNHPPAAQGIDQDPMIGIWLALGGSLLMALGALAAIARISVALEHPAAPAAARPTAPVAPRPGSPVAPPPTAPTAAQPASPVAPQGASPVGTDPGPDDEPPTRPSRSIFR